MYFIISVVDQSASPRTKTKTDGYHTLPAVLNNNNNNSNPILSSRTTVVAWTHVIINPPHRDQAKAHGVCVCRRHRRPRSAEAGKSDPIACGPRCLSLHSTLHKHHHHLPLRLSLFVLSNRPVEYHLSLSLPTSLQHPHSYHALPHFLHLPAVAPTQPRTAPSIAINPSASLLRSPPRPSWELLPRLITQRRPLPQRLSVNQHSLRVIYNTHTHQT
ncbi:hypothetical protein Q7P36_003043 [Cladosporium allicinum]